MLEQEVSHFCPIAITDDDDVPGMKSNIVRGTTGTSLSQARFPTGHHNTWACPNGRLWVYTARTGTEAWVALERWDGCQGLRNWGRDSDAPRDAESASTPTVSIPPVYKQVSNPLTSNPGYEKEEEKTKRMCQTSDLHQGFAQGPS